MTAKADEAILREMIAEFSRALEARDVDALMALYAEDIFLFDLVPPYKTVGKAAYRELWSHTLPMFPKKFKSEHAEIQFTIGSDVAFCHCLHHITAIEEQHPAGESWLRATVCYRKIDGQWKVVHEHVSMPMDPMSGKTFPIKTPGDMSTPDWNNCKK